jgi:ABC-type uncharacterized transport system involved in gliding motility auxiliary subunit
MKKSTVIIQALVITAIVVVLNMISNQVYFRLDFTADQRYTLSQATREILTELDDVVTVTAYFTQNLPPQLTQNRQDFEDLLIEYEQRAGGNLVYQFISPNEDEQLEREAQQNGIGPIIVNVTENDKVQQLKAYMGAYLQMGESAETIPLVQPGASMEYGLTTAIKKVSIQDKPKLGFVQGNGEPALDALSEVVEQLSVLYELEPFEISDTSAIPGYYKTVIMINPVDTIPGGHLAKIDQYLANGGNFFLAYSNVTGDLSAGGYLRRAH